MNWPNDIYTVEMVAKILCEQSGGDWNKKYTKRRHWTALAWVELAKFDGDFKRKHIINGMRKTAEAFLLSPERYYAGLMAHNRGVICGTKSP